MFKKLIMSKNLIILISIVAVVLAIAICSVVLVVLLNNKQEPTTPPSGGVVFDPNQEDDKDSPSQKPVAGGVAIAGFAEVTIPPNVTDITVDFKNPIANKDKYYQTFELRLLNDSEQGYEVLYKSGNVEAGKAIKNITIAHGLEEGEYDAIIHVQPYRMDGTSVNNANLKLKIIVE